jgi:hypothetical protein
VERIIRNRSATLTHTFYTGSTPTDPSPDQATVTVTRADGTVVAAGNALEGGTPGVVSFTLTPADTALLDVLTLVWTATFAGQPQTFVDTVEVVGDVYFTIADLRAFAPQAVGNTTTYPDSRIVEMRTTVEQTIEEAVGFAFVPRYSRDILSGDTTGWLRVRHQPVRAVRSVTDTGVAFTAGDLAAVSFDGSFLYGASWTSGYGNLIVGYEYGLDRPPERVKRAAMLLAKSWLVATPVDDRTATFTSVEGGGTYALVVPGRNGSIVGLPEIDAVIQQYRIPSLA